MDRFGKVIICTAIWGHQREAVREHLSSRNLVEKETGPDEGDKEKGGCH